MIVEENTPESRPDIAIIPENLEDDKIVEIDEAIIPEGSGKDNSSRNRGLTGNLFYSINRFIQSDGIPLFIFFLLGILALLIGIYLKQRGKTVAPIVGEVKVDKTKNGDPF